MKINTDKIILLIKAYDNALEFKKYMNNNQFCVT